MNFKVLSVLIIFAFAGSVNAELCPESCPPNRDPRCGFNGMCVYNFNNGCEMIKYNCQKGGFFHNTSPSYCQSAQIPGSLYRYCRKFGDGILHI